MSEAVKKLEFNRDLNDAELCELIESETFDAELCERADSVRRTHYGTDVYIRGLIEVSNICRNDCYYCGIRRSNTCAERFRLSAEQILSCAREGYRLGFRTFVLQGGEDPHFTDEVLCGIIEALRSEYPDCAVTLSLGERPRESYRRLFDAGAERYLLRHETADAEHYGRLHPAGLSIENRKRCLWELKEIGYQIGTGFMVGAPYQTTANIVSDIRFMQQLDPDMIGIGPFVTHRDTPFREFPSGSLQLTLRLLAMLRLLFPHALIPATTALGTIAEDGREKGLRFGANVIMPNLSPADTRAKYELYDGKLCTGDEAAEGLERLRKSVQACGYRIVTDRGDVRRSV